MNVKHSFNYLLTLGLILCFGLPNTLGQALPLVSPSTAGLDEEQLTRIDAVVEQGIREQKMPGCVVCIGRSGQIGFLKAYGHRQLQPQKIPMTVDTVFDLASLTKPIATATSIMMLVERGILRLGDRVSKHLPDFTGSGKEDITIRELLLHIGGLIPDNALRDYEDGPALAWKRINDLDLRAEPGEKFIYSDVGFLVLAEVVREKTGQNVHEFTQQNLFQPLGMLETGYLPQAALRERAATTEQREGRWMRGEVHDPRAYLLNGIAGHAGLFSTASDLAIYASMMLGEGTSRDKRILSPGTVRIMTDAYPVSSGQRGLGWDKQTGYSSNRGELMTASAFGHGGFTGTAIWIDPELDLFVIFLSNRVHPDGSGYVNPLAGRIGSIAVSAISTDSYSTNTEASNPKTANIANIPSTVSGEASALKPTLTGIDVLAADDFSALDGLRIGLITNHTGIDRDGKSTVEILNAAKNVNLKILFSPEHGFAGTLDQSLIANSQDPKTGLQVYSLYGETRRPTAEMLSGLDALVFDIQDIGTRFYTYVSTMGESMLAASESGIKFFVLDRPNPINGVDIAGPILDAGRESFVGFHQVPVRHGMTVGELAKMIQAEKKINLDLSVIPLKHWNRDSYFEQTGLLWVNPSPNMRSLTEAILYPGIGLLEMTNLSVGRGTDTPFEIIGAPWLDAQTLARQLNAAGLPGVSFIPTVFRPDASKFAGEECQGVQIAITDRADFRSVDTGLQIAKLLRELHPEGWQMKNYDRLLADTNVFEAVKRGASLQEIKQAFESELQDFKKRRESYLLYR